MGALETAERIAGERADGVVVVVLPDWGERYLSIDGFRPSYGRRSTDLPGQPLRRKTDISKPPSK